MRLKSRTWVFWAACGLLATACGDSFDKCGGDLSCGDGGGGATAQAEGGAGGAGGTPVGGTTHNPPTAGNGGSAGAGGQAEPVDPRRSIFVSGDFGVPLKKATVVVHDASGAVLDSGLTDDTGLIKLEVPAGGAVTAAANHAETDLHASVTLFDLPDTSSLQIVLAGVPALGQLKSRTPMTVSFQGNTSLTSSSISFVIPCALTAYANPGTPTSDRSLELCPSVDSYQTSYDVYAFAHDNGSYVGVSVSKDQPFTPGGSVDHGLSISSTGTVWYSLNATQLATTRARFTLEALRTGTRHPLNLWESRDVSQGAATMKFPLPSALSYDWVYLSADAREQVPRPPVTSWKWESVSRIQRQSQALPTQLDWNATTALATVDSASDPDATAPDRMELSWELAAAKPKGDYIRVSVSADSENGSHDVHWTGYTRVSDSGSIKAPELPSELEDYLPFHNGLAEYSVTHVDVVDLSNYTEFVTQARYGVERSSNSTALEIYMF